MGTRGSVLFTDAYDQWVYVDTRYDGHTMQAAFEIATLPFARLARAESELAAALAKGDLLILDHKFGMTLETFAQGLSSTVLKAAQQMPVFLPFGPIANPLDQDATPNSPEIGSYLAREATHGALESIDHMERFLAFGEYDATSMARDFCSRQDRWIVSASGTGPIPAAYQDADIHVKTLDESRSGNIAITFACHPDDYDQQTPEQLATELAKALNAPLAPFHAYTVTPNLHPPLYDDEVSLTISCSMNWVFCSLISRIMLAHPEFAQGLRNAPLQTAHAPENKPNLYASWVADGLIEPPTVMKRNESYRFLLGLPVSPSRIDADPLAKPRWLFTRRTVLDECPFGSHTPIGMWRLPPDTSKLSTTVALSLALARLGSEEIAAPSTAIAQIRALTPIVGPTALGAAIDLAKSHGMVDNLSPAAAQALALIERELIQNHTPKVNKKAGPLKTL